MYTSKVNAGLIALIGAILSVGTGAMAQAPCELGKLTAADADAEDHFGYFVVPEKAIYPAAR